MISTATLAQAGKQQGAALLRFLAILILALLVFAIVLLVFGKNPIEAYVDIFTSTIGSSYGWSEVLVKVIPLVLCATAVLLPARIGLVNVSGEGQLYIGALVASWGALALADVLPGFLGLPTIILLGFIGGEDGPVEAVAKPAVFYDLPDLTINLASPDKRSQYLRIKVALEVSKRETIDEITPMLPRVMDAFQVYLRELRMTDLEGSAGIYRLKEELRRRVNLAIHPAQVDDILFKELLIQ